MAEASIAFENSKILVSGQLDFSSVMSVWNNSLLLLEKSSALFFDFSEVTATNSAGLALLLEWIKYAKQRQKSIEFHALPEQLRSIAAVAGLDKSIGLF